MTKIGAAVVGLGVGRSHADAYATLPESDLVAVCDQQPERLRAATEKYGARAYSEVADLLRDERVEVVSIATPHPSHAKLAIAALESGRHVIVEKPMAVSLSEADAMIEAARRTDRKLAVIFQRRFWPASLRLRDAIDGGRLGWIISAECEVSWWRTEQYYARDPWRGRWDTEGGGVLINQGIHALDLLCWYAGEAETVWARWANLSHPYIEVEDNVVASVGFRNGALGVIRMSTSSRLSRLRIAVHGDNGSSASVREEPEGATGFNDLWVVPGEERVADESFREHVERGEYFYRPESTPPHVWQSAYEYKRLAEPTYHALQIQEFLRAVREDREPLVNGEEGRKSLELMLAIYQSGRTGLPVSLPMPR